MLKLNASQEPRHSYQPWFKVHYLLTSLVFYGFLPQKKGRKTIIEQIGKEDRTVVLYESPHRMKKLVEQLLEYIGDRPFSYSREISKLHHEQYRGTVKEALNHLEENIVKGEYVVVIGRSHE